MSASGRWLMPGRRWASEQVGWRVDIRRQELRLTINKEFDSFDQFVREYVTNISRSGVFIKTAEPLRVGSIVNLKFTVVMDDIETIEGEGEVVRRGGRLILRLLPAEAAGARRHTAATPRRRPALSTRACRPRAGRASGPRAERCAA